MPETFRTFALIALAALPAFSHAQTYPAKPIRVIMAVQGGAEVTVRLMANKVSEAIGQPLVIEMMPGAGGAQAAESVMRAAPDGYTIMYTGASAMVIRKFVTCRSPICRSWSITPGKIPANSPGAPRVWVPPIISPAN